MSAIIETHVRDSGAGCDHRTMTVRLDGELITLKTGERELDGIPWNDANKKLFLMLGLKRLRAAGLVLDNCVGLCTNGDEGSNVRQWTLLDAPTTKTNIGTSYVNVLAGLNGLRTLIDFTGCTQLRVMLHVNCVGTGPWGARVVRDGDSAILWENALIVGAGEKEIDTGWIAIPAAAAITGETLVRLQGKSVVGADDPIFRRAILLAK